MYQQREETHTAEGPSNKQRDHTHVSEHVKCAPPRLQHIARILSSILLLALLSVSMTRMPFWDEITYQQLAWNASYAYPTPTGSSPEAFRPPGYPWILHILNIHSIREQRILSISIMLISLFSILRFLPALSGLALISSLPAVVGIGLTEAIQFLISLAFFITIQQKPRKTRIILTGGLILLGFLIKYSLILLLLPWLVWLIQHRPRREELLPSISILSILVLSSMLAWQAWLPQQVPTPVSAFRMLMQTLSINPTSLPPESIFHVLSLSILSLPVFFSWRRFRRQLPALILLASLPFLLRMPEQHYRYYIFLLPAVAFLAAEGEKACTKLIRPARYMLAGISIILSSGIMLLTLHTTLSMYPSWQDAVADTRVLGQFIQKNETICATNALPLSLLLNRSMMGQCSRISQQGARLPDKLILYAWEQPPQGWQGVGRSRYYHVYMPPRTHSVEPTG